MKTQNPRFLIPLRGVLILCLFFTCTIYAQTENLDHVPVISASDLHADRYKIVLAQFEKYYNRGYYDSIFDMFSKDMQQQRTLNTTRAFFINLKRDVGAIVVDDFDKFDEDGAFYKTKFENSLAILKISVNEHHRFTDLNILPYQALDTFPEMPRNITQLQLPFKGQWTVLWGGDTKELNHHIVMRAEKNAFDIVIDKDGKSYKTDGKTNEDYYDFGQPIFAPCNARVVVAVDGIKDNQPGKENKMFGMGGNSVILKTANNEYLVFAHFKQNSIKVKEGQKVKQGQFLALCGNSGNSTEPHLHFHIENIEDINMATGVKCYFNKILVNGKVLTDYSPIKADVVENIKK